MAGNFSNIKGTTVPSFRIGAKGVTLSSGAIENGLRSDIYRLYATADGKAHKVLYDCDIPSAAISSYRDDPEDSNYIIFTLYDRSEIRLVKNIPINTVNGPNKSVIGDVPVFANETGNELADSNLGILSKNLESIEETEADKIPTAKAVFSYIGNITDILKNRLTGSLKSSDED